MAYKFNPFTCNLDLVAAGFITAEVGFTSQTSIVVTHNNGYRPPVFVINSSNEELIPLNITHTTINQFTVTFSTAKTGTIIYGITGTASGSDSFPIVVEKSDTYTTLATDGTIKCIGDKSFTVTLITAAGRSGQVQRVKHAGTGVITVKFDELETADDENELIINAGTAGAYVNLSFQSDNTNWMIV